MPLSHLSFSKIWFYGGKEIGDFSGLMKLRDLETNAILKLGLQMQKEMGMKTLETFLTHIC